MHHYHRTETIYRYDSMKKVYKFAALCFAVVILSCSLASRSLLSTGWLGFLWLCVFLGLAWHLILSCPLLSSLVLSCPLLSSLVLPCHRPISILLVKIFRITVIIHVVDRATTTTIVENAAVNGTHFVFATTSHNTVDTNIICVIQ